MTLEQLAKLAGVKIIEFEHDKWGGSVGYTDDRFQNITICGFRCKKSAYQSWLKSRLGDKAAKAVMKLLED